MNTKSFLIVPFFFVNMANAYSNEEARAAMYTAKMDAEKLESVQKDDVIRKQGLSFICWKRGLRQEGSSVEIVKEHFPEIYSIVETGFELHTIEYSDYQTLMNFVDETKELLEEEYNNNRLDNFPPKSKAQSRVFLCDLICRSAFMAFIAHKVHQENREEMIKRAEEVEKKKAEYINRSTRNMQIAGGVAFVVLAGIILGKN